MPVLPALTFLANELRRAREAAGLTQNQLGDQINYAGSFVGMVETMRRMPKVDFTRRCDEALNTGGLLTRLLLELVQSETVPAWFRPWIESEREASTLRAFDPLIIYGLLQTREYARAIFRSSQIGSDEEVERAVDARIARQEILIREDPPMLVVVMGEEALRRPIGGPDVMRAQLEHLVEVAENRSNVLVQIVPLEVGEYSGVNGPFVIAGFAGADEIVFLDDALSGQVVQRPDHVAGILRRWELIKGEALPQKQSVNLIREVIKSWP